MSYLPTRHAVEFCYTHQEIEAPFRIARHEDVEKGGHYDALYSTINVWSHHWVNPET
jgi:hypothetical protein